MEEVWKKIPNYENYDVSNLGKIRNSKTSILRKTSIFRTGYEMVVLFKNGKRKNCSVHRLVAEAFIPNPNNLPEVNHKDEIKTNNFVDNLEWCTRIYNENYGTGIKRGIETKRKNGTLGSHTSRNKGEKNPNSKITNEQVKYIRNNYIKNDKVFGGTALAKRFGVRKECIYRILSNKRRSE